MKLPRGSPKGGRDASAFCGFGFGLCAGRALTSVCRAEGERQRCRRYPGAKPLLQHTVTGSPLSSWIIVLSYG